MKQKRYLIVTASIGSGHIKAAEAIRDALRQQDSSASVHILDFMAKKVSWLNWLMKAIYLRMLALVPNLYEFCYRVTGGEQGGSRTRGFLAWVMARAMRRIIDKYRPDVLICTHPFPEGAASYLCRKPHDFYFATVMTDYSVHQIWLYPHVDGYFVATEDMRREMLKQGFAEHQVIATGIPISPMILSRPNQPALTDAALAEDCPVLLFMGGGLGLGGIDEAIAELDALDIPMQIVVVTGYNRVLAEKLRIFSETARHKVCIIGYTDQVPALMARATLLISKPGALTISEAMALGLPMLLHEPIPGPETENAIHAARMGAAIWVHGGFRLSTAAADLLKQPERLERMRACAFSASRPHAAQDIVLYLMQGKS